MQRSQVKAPPSALSAEWIILNATVFVSSAAIMMIELVAGRIIAKHLGASVYTWTSVIGIVLAGIAIGNYIGGLIADKHSNKKTLALLFMLGSAMSGAITLLDRFAADLSFLWTLSWPMRVALHVGIGFFIPTMFLGMISPVIAKMALDLGRERGRTIGDIYAFGVVGSIFGTFIAGYFLIAALGTLGVVWAVAVILAAMAFFYGRSPATFAWAVAACFLTFLSTSHADWARNIGESLKLRPTRDKEIIYSTESDYSYIQIVQISKDPDVRGMHLDTLLHSQLDMDRPGDFRYDYEKVYLAITLRMRPNADRIDSLTIGGGGYVYPRYMNARWPRGRTDVVEIDPAVTEAAMVAFGLPRDTTIRPFHEDGRVYIDRLIAEKREGKPVEPYDFIYCDAVNDYSVPHQLTTREFMSEVHELIKPDGAYLMNMIDIYESDKFDGGLLLGSLITTMKDVFKHINVFIVGVNLNNPDGSPNKLERARRNTFIIAGTDVPLETQNLGELYGPNCIIFPLSQKEIDDVQNRAERLVLTDDYAPVENLLADVVKDSATNKAVGEWDARARMHMQAGDLDKAIAICEHGLTLFPDLSMSYLLLETMGNALIENQEYYKAAEKFEKLLDLNASPENAHGALATCYTKLKDYDRAIGHHAFIADLHPENATIVYNLGITYMEMGNFAQAEKRFRQVLEQEPEMCDAYNNVGYCRKQNNDLRNAMAYFRKALACSPSHPQARMNIDAILGKDSAKIEAEIERAKAVAAAQPADADNLAKIVQGYYDMRMAEETLEWVDKLLALTPQSVDALVKRANVLVEMGRLDEAKAAYLKVLEIEPTRPGMKESVERIEAFQKRQAPAQPTAPQN